MAWYEEQVGPLPLGVWLAAIGGGLGIAAWGRRKAGAAGDVDVMVGDELTPSPLGRTQGLAGAIPLPGTNSSTSTLYAQPATNEEWVAVASRALILAGFSPVMVTTALVRYLEGQTLSASERQAVDAALRLVGPPPVPATTPAPAEPSSGPTAGQTVPVPSPTPAAPAPLASVGETLPGYPAPPPGMTSTPIVVQDQVIGVQYVPLAVAPATWGAAADRLRADSLGTFADRWSAVYGG